MISLPLFAALLLPHSAALAQGPESSAEEMALEEKPKPKKSKKALAKPRPAKESKYKSRELTEGVERSYRFNEKGEPIRPKSKSESAKKKKSAESADDGLGELGACGAESEEACSGKPAGDADAL